MFKLSEYTSNSHSYFAFGLKTPYERDIPNHSTLHICLFRHAWWIDIPPILKPKAVQKEKYVDYIQRDYGFVFTDDALHIHYGIQPGCWSSTDKKNSDHTKVFFYFWKERRREYVRFLNPDGTLFEEYRNKPNGVSNFDKLRDAEKRVPKVKIKFNDYDGEEITATCHIELTKYRLGGYKWFKWYGYLRKPEFYRRVQFTFDKETGYEKGSWKGGTTGHSCLIEEGESILDAFKRYGAEEDYYKYHGKKPRAFTNIRVVE